LAVVFRYSCSSKPMKKKTGFCPDVRSCNTHRSAK
jgi:hypothetical protein